MRHPYRILVSFSLLACFAHGAVAARFPDSVQRTFVVDGAPARAFCALFGIASSQETVLEFPILGTAGMTSNKNYRGDGSNRISFSSENEKWRVVLGDNWYDNTTGSSQPVPRYSFISPFIDPRLAVDNGWGTLLRQLRVQLPERKEHAAIVSHIHTDEDASPFLDVLVYIVYDYTQLMPNFRFSHRPVIAKFSVSNERRSPWYRPGLLKKSSHALRNSSNDS